MRILALSDIFWSPMMHGTNLAKLKGLARRVDPDLVLLAGDLVDDKFISSDERNLYWQEALTFLHFLEDRKLDCLIVKGNWDNHPKYHEITRAGFNYVREISEKVVEIEGVRVLGVSHAFTNKLSTMRMVQRLYTGRIDIVLAHANTGDASGYLNCLQELSLRGILMKSAVW